MNPSETICRVCRRPVRTTVFGSQCPACLLTLAADEPATEDVWGTFGEYSLEEVIGRGGMGTVYRAWQDRLNRHVALKVMSRGIFAAPDALSYFRREARMAAMLRHPGIITIYDAGETDGQAFYTMELVEGGTLADMNLPMDARKAAGWMESIARAVAHAHSHGVLHRDLKPGNILISPEGAPMVADFGLAFPAGEPAWENTIVGSPPYMAPEVAEGSQATIASDIHSLGAVLHEMLHGQPPPAESTRPVPHDLAAILHKCLAPAPADRYPAAMNLANDLRRWLDGRSVNAAPAGPAGLIGKWMKRNKALTGLIVFAFATVAGGAFSVVQQARRNATQMALLKKEQIVSAAASQQLAENLYAADMRAATQEIVAGNPVAARRWLEAHRDDPLRGVEWGLLMARSAGNPHRDLAHFPAYVRDAFFSPDGKRMAVSLFQDRPVLRDLASGKETSLDHDKALVAGFSPRDGGLYLCSGGELRVYHPPDGQARAIAPAARAVLSADGKRAVLLSKDSLFFAPEGGRATLMDLENTRTIWELPGESIVAAELSKQGSLVALAHLDGGVTLWNTDTRSKISEWDLPLAHVLAFSPDGAMLAAAGRDRAWLLTANGASVTVLNHGTGQDVTGLSFSADGQRLATSCTDRSVRIWNLPDGSEGETLHGHESEVWSVNWNSHDDTLISTGKNGFVKQWNTRAGFRRTSIPQSVFARPVFGEEGKVIVAGGLWPDWQASLWDPADGKKIHEFPPRCFPAGRANGHTLLKDLDRSAFLWHSDATAPSDPTAATLPIPKCRTRFSYQTALSPDGRLLAWLDDFGVLSLMPARLDPAEPVRTCRMFPDHGGKELKVRSFVWSADSRRLAATVEEPPFRLSTVELADLTVRQRQAGNQYLTGAAFSPDGRWIAAGGVEGDITVWQTDNDEPSLRFQAHGRNVADLVFAPSGKTLLSLGTHEGVKFWNTATWREVSFLPVPTAFAHLAISPDERWLAVTCRDHEMKLNTGIYPLANETTE